MTDGNTHDCQTDETSFPPAPPMPKALFRPKARKAPLLKPPFECYGRGNKRPLNSLDMMASFNLNPLLHPTCSSSGGGGGSEKPHKVFTSTLRRANYDPTAYSSKALAARGICCAAQGVGADFPAQARGGAVLTYPTGAEVEVFPAPCGLMRDVATQRTTFLLEDAVSEALLGAQGQVALNLPLLAQRIPRLRALEGHRYTPVTKQPPPSAAAGVAHGGTPLWKEHQASIGKGAPLPFSPGRFVLTREEYLSEAGRCATPASPTPPPAAPAAARTPATPLHLQTPTGPAPGTRRSGPAPPIIPNSGPRAGQVVTVDGKAAAPAAPTPGSRAGASTGSAAPPASSWAAASLLGQAGPMQLGAPLASLPPHHAAGTPMRKKGDSSGARGALDWASGAPQQDFRHPHSPRDPHYAHAPPVAPGAADGEVLVKVSGSSVPAFELVPLPPELGDLRPPSLATLQPPSTAAETAAALERKAAARAARAAAENPAAGAIAAATAAAASAAATSSALAAVLPKPVSLRFNTKTWEALDDDLPAAGSTSEALVASLPPPRPLERAYPYKQTKKEASLTPSEGAPTPKA